MKKQFIMIGNDDKSEKAAFLEKGDEAFKALMRRADNGETPNLTMEEIDEEIRKARAER